MQTYLTHRYRSGLTALAAVLVLGAFALSACKSDGGSEPAVSYTVRGQLKTLPVEGQSAGITIHHEEIPEFVNRQGKKSGMMSMSMPFGVADGASLDGLAIGDKVEFTFDVNWERAPATHVTAIKKLPADTALTLTGM